MAEAFDSMSVGSSRLSDFMRCLTMSHEIGRHKLFWARYSITFYDFYPDFYEIGNGSGGTSFHLLRRNCIYS